jgi:hypothetical protein
MTRHLDVLLLCRSSSEHLTQLYTGFGMLRQAGLVDLRIQRDAGSFVPGVSAPSILTVEVEDRRIVYDLADGPSYFEQPLEACDSYFKRSYDPARADAHPLGDKVYPLGLNYPVYGRGDFAPRRALWSITSALSRDVMANAN